MLFLVMFSVTTGTLISGEQLATSDSACNGYTVPYSFWIEHGNPTLSCTFPVCFGKKWKHELERGDVILETDQRNSFGLSSIIQKAQCQKIYQNNSCSDAAEWTAGILFEDDGNSTRVKWKCCIYESLRHAKLLRTVNVEVGDRYTGGEVFQNGQRVAFDLIKEITQSFDGRNRPRYELKIMRLSCIPKQTEFKNKLATDENSGLNASAKDFSSEYDDDEEYVPKNLHRTTFSRSRSNKLNRHFNRRSTVPEEDGLDGLLAPKHRMTRRRMFPLHRTPFFKPIADDYDYYDYDPVFLRRPSAHRRVVANDRLWPINYGFVGRRRPVVAAGAAGVAPPSLNGFAFPNEVDGEYHQLVDGDSATGTVTSAPAEVVNQQPPPVATGNTDTNNYNYNVEAHNQIEVQPSPGQAIPAYPSVQQYPPQTVVVHPEPRIVPVVQQTVPLRTGAVPYYNGYFETLQCFSGDTTVRTPDRIKQIDELKVGDRVLSVEESVISYSPVVMFLHRSDNESAIFNKIILKNGKTVKLTDYHLLYVTDCTAGEQLRLTYAKDVRLGQCLHVVKMQSNTLFPIQISNIHRVVGKGIYAPLTATGDIVVNSVLASCHCNVAVQTLQQSLFTVLRYLYLVLPIDGTTTGLLPGIQFITQISHFFLPQSIVW